VLDTGVDGRTTVYTEGKPRRLEPHDAEPGTHVAVLRLGTAVMEAVA
jgi:hypothetical protein